MKKIYLFLLAGLLSAVFFGCSDPSGPGDPSPVVADDDEPEVLDLRIKNNGVVYSVNKAAGNPSGANQSDHVKVENVAGGVKFTITKPSDFDRGWGWVGIYKFEKVSKKSDEEKTTRIDFFRYGDTTTESFTAFWPMVTPGKSIKFQVFIQGPDGMGDKEYIEYVSITPNEGIGEISYAGLKKSAHVVVEKEDGKFYIKEKKVIPPEGKVVKTGYSLFACFDPQDWSTTTCIRQVNLDSAESKVEIPSDLISAAKADPKGYTHIFVEYFYSIEVEESTDGVYKTVNITSPICKLN